MSLPPGVNNSDCYLLLATCLSLCFDMIALINRLLSAAKGYCTPSVALIALIYGNNNCKIVVLFGLPYA